MKNNLVTFKDFVRADIKQFETEAQTCAVCYKICKDREARKRHEKFNHRNRKSLKCENCDMLYTNKKALEYHLKTKHDSSVKRINCEFCSKTFSTQNNMRIHRRTIHCKKSEDIYECDFCDKIFTHLNNLSRHEKECHKFTDYNIRYVNIEKLIHICDHCPETFTRKSNLIRHKEISHEKEKLEFKCSSCGISYSRKDSLQRHKKVKHPDK